MCKILEKLKAIFGVGDHILHSSTGSKILSSLYCIGDGGATEKLASYWYITIPLYCMELLFSVIRSRIANRDFKFLVPEGFN